MEEEKSFSEAAVSSAGKNQKLISSSCSAEKVASNDDLSTEILLRLPVRSVLRSKAVSKHWYSLITNPSFPPQFFDRNPNLLNPSGVFLPLAPHKGVMEYEFVPLDAENQIRKPPFRTLNFDHPAKPQFETSFGPFLPDAKVQIVQSSNGLMLCRSISKRSDTEKPYLAYPYTIDGYDYKYFVYNPTTKGLASLEVSKRTCGITLVFDPRKSPHYRIVCMCYKCICYKKSCCWLQIYSSEARTWTASGQLFRVHEFWFKSGVYWNDALHWVDRRVGFWYLKLDDESLHETQIPPLPVGTFYGHRHANYLVESFDCLLYVDTFCPYPEKFNVYEMERDYSGWTVKYAVDLSQLAEWQPNFWFKFLIHSLVLGQREEDSFLVFRMAGQAIRYNLVSKTSQKLCGFGPDVRSCLEWTQFDSLTAQMPGFLFIESLFPV